MFGLNARQIKKADGLEGSGDVIRSCDHNVSEIVAIIDALARENHNYRIDHQDPIGESLEKLRKHLAEKEKNELERAVLFSMKASETVSAVSFVTADVRESAENTNTIASAIEELNTSVNEISMASNAVADDAETTKQSVQSGLAAIDRSANNMDLIMEATADAETKLKKLEMSYRDIGKILSMIDGISRQTNLLALNATIEAARAGEAGLGFAVVAGEVKQLAQQTSKATEEIRERIGAVSSEIQSLSVAVRQASGSVEVGRSDIFAVREQMAAIFENIERVTARMATTASSVTEQSAAIGDVSRSVCIIQSKTERARQNAERVVTAVAHSEETLNSELKRLATREIENSILDIAKSDHFEWKKRLARMLIGADVLDQSTLVDHRQCRLGQWYYRTADPCFSNSPSFVQLETPHRAVHEHGRQVVELFHKGDLEGAAAAYAQLEAASDEVVRLLEDLKQSKH